MKGKVGRRRRRKKKCFSYSPVASLWNSLLLEVIELNTVAELEMFLTC